MLTMQCPQCRMNIKQIVVGEGSVCGTLLPYLCCICGAIYSLAKAQAPPLDLEPLTPAQAGFVRTAPFCAELRKARLRVRARLN